MQRYVLEFKCPLLGAQCTLLVISAHFEGEETNSRIQHVAGTRMTMKQNIKWIMCLPSGVTMATDLVAQLADSLAKAGVEDGELSYKGQGRKLDDAQSGECHCECFKSPRNPAHSYTLLIWITVLIPILNLSPLRSGGNGEGDPGLQWFAGSEVGGKHCWRGGSTGNRQGPWDKERVQGKGFVNSWGFW